MLIRQLLLRQLGIRGWASLPLLAAILAGGVRCVPYRSVPVSQAPKLSGVSLAHDDPVVVEDLEGRLYRIEGFDRLLVRPQVCENVEDATSIPSDRWCYVDEVAYNPPVELILVQDELWARSLSPNGPPKAFRFRTEQIESLRIEDSRLRDHVLLAASLAGLVAGGITVAAVDDPYSPFTDIGASILAFGATFGLAIPIGYLIVGKPGSEVDPPD